MHMDGTALVAFMSPFNGDLGAWRLCSTSWNCPTHRARRSPLHACRRHLAPLLMPEIGLPRPGEIGEALIKSPKDIILPAPQNSESPGALKKGTGFRLSASW